MSLTSYRAAPSRDTFVGLWLTRFEAGFWPIACSARLGLVVFIDRLESLFGDFSRFGGDLLSRGLSPSTIGAAVLNFRVRDGTGCFTCAMTTKPRKIPVALFAKQKGDEQEAAYSRSGCAFLHGCVSINTVSVCAAKATKPSMFNEVYVFDLSFHYWIKSSLSGD